MFGCRVRDGGVGYMELSFLVYGFGREWRRKLDDAKHALGIAHKRVLMKVEEYEGGDAGGIHTHESFIVSFSAPPLLASRAFVSLLILLPIPTCPILPPLASL